MMKEQKKQVLLGKEYREGGFIKAYHSLPFNLLTTAREEICQLCFWNEDKFRRMLSGTKPFRFYEIEQLEDYFKLKNINAWTGEPLN
jgi:hypothetical protein